MPRANDASGVGYGYALGLLTDINLPYMRALRECDEGHVREAVRMACAERGIPL